MLNLQSILIKKLKTLLLYIYYFFRSVVYRGLFNTLQLIGNESKTEKLFGIDTARIKKSDNPDNFHYQGAGYLILFRVFNELPEHLKFSGLIDYGSGKGRALFCAEYCGFNRLIGVELDPELNSIAENNLRRYTKKRKESSFEFYTENALNFEIPENCSTFYFFNPFSDAVMSKVAERIRDYAIRNKREVYVVYLNPTFKNLWTDKGFSVYKLIKTQRYTETIVYTYINSDR